MNYSQGELYAFAESELLKKILEDGYMPIRYALEISDNDNNVYSPELVQLANDWLRNNLQAPQVAVTVSEDINPFELPY